MGVGVGARKGSQQGRLASWIPTPSPFQAEALGPVRVRDKPLSMFRAEHSRRCHGVFHSVRIHSRAGVRDAEMGPLACTVAKQSVQPRRETDTCNTGGWASLQASWGHPSLPFPSQLFALDLVQRELPKSYLSVRWAVVSSLLVYSFPSSFLPPAPHRSLGASCSCVKHGLECVCVLGKDALSCMRVWPTFIHRETASSRFCPLHSILCGKLHPHHCSDFWF